MDAIYFEFAKAFDTVPHQRLLVKLAGYGIGANFFSSMVANHHGLPS